MGKFFSFVVLYGSKHQLADIEQIHHVLDTVVNIISVVFNVFLLYLIAYHSTYGVRVYQVLLAVDASLDLVLGIASIIVQPVGRRVDRSQ